MKRRSKAKSSDTSEMRWEKYW